MDIYLFSHLDVLQWILNSRIRFFCCFFCQMLQEWFITALKTNASLNFYTDLIYFKQEFSCIFNKEQAVLICCTVFSYGSKILIFAAAASKFHLVLYNFSHRICSTNSEFRMLKHGQEQRKLYIYERYKKGFCERKIFFISLMIFLFWRL